MKNKKHFLLSMMAIAIVTAIVLFNTNKEIDSLLQIRDLAFTQIEALAGDEGDTNVGICYTDHYQWESTQHLHCNSNTSSSTIYPCRSSWCSGGGISSANCTK